MRPILRFIASVGLTAAIPITAAAQQPARYRGHPDTVYVQTYNPFRMYWVRGADTVGAPQNVVRVERVTDVETADGLAHVVVGLGQDVQRKETTTRYDLSPMGQVLRVDGKAPSWETGVDELFHLPSIPLVTGAAWADSVGIDSVGGPVPLGYHVARSYRVDRVVDTLGARVADVSATGRVRFTAGFVPDSAGRYRAWMDARGPVTERYLFDLTHGRMIYRRWSMDLHGPGTLARPDGGVDTVPAGLRSDEVEREVPVDVGRVLARALPGSDTMYTVGAATGGTMLLHTTARESGVVRTGMARNDGMVGTAVLRYTGAMADEYDAVWTDSTETVDRYGMTRQGQQLALWHGSAVATLTAPTAVWAVADYGFEEMLAPVVLARGADTTAVPFAIYRPFPKHWDLATLTVRRANGVVGALIQMKDGPEAQLIFTEEGQLLFARNLPVKDGFRVPADGSAGARKLEALRGAMRAAGARPTS